MKIGDRVVDLKAKFFSKPDSEGEIILIDGSDIRIRYDSGNIVQSRLENLIVKEEWIKLYQFCNSKES